MTPMVYVDSFPVEHKMVTVDGIKMFYRDSGPPDAPVILLLHGFPSSSRMFSTLIPLLSSRFRLIAPDFPGFGHSDAPSPKAFSYTFDHLAECIGSLLRQLDVSRYTLYVQDYGGPVGFILASANPERVSALVIQNAVAHLEGLSESWAARKAFWLDRTANEGQIRQALLSADGARQRHLAGASRPALIDPDTWSDELAFLTRPGMADIQLDLVYDYRTNLAAYPRWQKYLRESRPPTLVVWGKNDPLFTVAGAMAFGRDVPDAEIHLLNASHFALDEEVLAIAALMNRFLGATVCLQGPSSPGRQAVSWSLGAFPFMKILGLDHVVLRCRDLDRMSDFYTNVLGCSLERRVEHLGLIHLRAGAALIDLVSVEGELGKVGGPPPGIGARNMDHLCLRVEPFDFVAIRRHFAAHVVELSPVQQNFGAEGDGPSVYLKDPESNGIELKGPFSDHFGLVADLDQS